MSDTSTDKTGGNGDTSGDGSNTPSNNGASVQPSSDPTTPPAKDSSKPTPTPSDTPTQQQQQSSAQPTSDPAQPTSKKQTQQQQQQQSSTEDNDWQPQSSAAPTHNQNQWSQQPSSEAASPTAPASSSAQVTSSSNNGPSTISLPSSSSSLEEVTTTDANGKAVTVTAVVHQATNAAGGSSQDQTKSGTSGFFGNTGAVAGVFVVLGLLVTSAVLAAFLFIYRRKRRQRLDRDVARAAAASSRSRSRKNSGGDMGGDDEKVHSGHSEDFAGYYGDLNNVPVQDQAGGFVDYADPSGGYDNYAAMNVPPIGVAGDRMSTATEPGFAGFGAQAAANAYNHNAYDDITGQNQMDNNGYEELHRGGTPEGGYNAISTDNSAQPQTTNGYYFDPRQANQFEFDDQHEDDGHDMLPPSRHHRGGSDGSVALTQNNDRSLTVTNG